MHMASLQHAAVLCQSKLEAGTPKRSKSIYSASPRRQSEHGTIGDFKIGKVLGKGSFSKVMLGFHVDSGKKARKPP
jgi:hypothetical protein